MSCFFGSENDDTVFYDENLDSDFASWVFGDLMVLTYLNEKVVLIKQTGFDYDGVGYTVDWNEQTYIKKFIAKKMGCT